MNDAPKILLINDSCRDDSITYENYCFKIPAFAGIANF